MSVSDLAPDDDDDDDDAINTCTYIEITRTGDDTIYLYI